MNLRKAYEIRGYLFRFLKQYESILISALKFLCFLIVFRWISGNEMFAGDGLINSGMFQIALSIVAAVLPNRVGVLLALFVLGYNFIASSLLGGALLVVFLLVLFIITVQVTPEYTYMMLLVPVCIMTRMYMLLPLLAGLYIGPVTIVPLLTGTLLWGVWQIAPAFIGMESGELALDQLPQLITSASEYGVEQLLKNKELAFVMVIFAVIVLITYLVSKIQKDYIHYIALGVASAAGFVCLLICKMTTGLYIGYAGIIFGSIGSFVLAIVIQFLSLPVNYKAAQTLSFSDDEFFYQVKVIPKINVGKEKKEVKKITRTVRPGSREDAVSAQETRIRGEWNKAGETSTRELSDTMRMNTETFFFNNDKE